MEDNNLPHVVVLGGGFAGLSAVKSLADTQVKITLIDRENHHLFQPLLYQVATAGLSAADIAQPLRHILEEQDNLLVLMDEVTEINTTGRLITTRDSSISYDYLIVALGVKTSYFGNNDWAPFAPGLKTLDEATEIRRRVLLAFEEAEIAKRSYNTDRPLNLVVVGGGPTGVELAGALAELSQFVLSKEFHLIEPVKAEVHLIEAGPRLLSAFLDEQSNYTLKELESMGVTVHLNTPVTEMTENSVIAGDLTIDSSVVLWAAGVESCQASRSVSGVERDRAGRIKVTQTLTIPEHDNVFVIGDLAASVDCNNVRVPGVAPAAIQMGKHAASQIDNHLKRLPLQPFAYTDKGNMATIGRRRAVAQFGKHMINGILAWFLWLSVHLLFLVGLRNRITVLHQWVWSYFSWQLGARIITKKRISEPT